VLLLGALIVSADLGYAESQFHWLGTEWQWYLLILAAFHGVVAYSLRSSLVLCTSIAALAAWFGIEGHAAILFDVGGSAAGLGMHAIGCAGSLLVWRAANHRLGGPESFESVFENFAANIGFWGALALCLTPGSRLLGSSLLAALAAASIFKALRNREEIFAVYGTAYAALTLCCLEAQVIKFGLASGIFALAALIVGIQRRSHAPLLAALGLGRYLRTSRRGITSLRLGQGAAALDLAQWIGAGALSPRAAPQADAPFKGGGGVGGGGGADGSY
jgi:hypothetical protein